MFLLLLQNFIAESDAWCNPRSIFICDGSADENNELLQIMHYEEQIEPLVKYHNW